MYKIRTYNAISSKGLSRFPTDSYQVSSESTDADGILLRSQKLHTEVMPESVVAIARAGAGTNNIPVADYTDKGIVVFNTPGANANAVKELIVAALLMGSRDIYGGMNYVQGLTEITDSVSSCPVFCSFCNDLCAFLMSCFLLLPLLFLSFDFPFNLPFVVRL